MELLSYVNIKQGTDSTERLSRGNTLPLVQKPFGFSSLSPQTNGQRDPWFYSPRDRSFEGYRFTHQPSSPWINERGALVVSVATEEPSGNPFYNWSPFDENKTVLTPYYLLYYLKRHRATFETTPTEYGALFRAHFEKDLKPYLSFNPCLGGKYSYRFDKEKNRLFVSADFDFWWAESSEKVIVYYCFEFPKDSINTDEILVEEVSECKKQRGNEISGISTAIHLPLTVKEITFTGAQSYIGFDFAERNLESGDFDEVKDENKALWENMLSRVEIEGSEELKKTFYSCLYRGLLFPHRAYELDAEGRKVHFAPSLGEAREGPRYTDNGFWDTYRTVYPFLSVVYPEVLEEMMEGFLADYLDGGWLPRWSALNGKNCMPSTAIDVVIADLSLKGIIGGDLLRKLFEGMEKHALTPAPNDVYGREGVEDYLTLGYIPFDKRELNSVNLTVDASYHDYCLSVVSEILGEKEKALIYKKRSENWRRLFDKESGCLRARFGDGSFYPDFNPKGWGFEYTEASPLVTTFSPQHDFEGLEELFGGREAFLERLEGLFETDNEFYVARWNRAIHEMAEYSEEKWGAVAISNEPSFHIPFIFALLGEKEKASYWVKRIATEAFSYKDDGFPGDEDNGAMSLWFCLAVMGIYPVCPGKEIFTVTDKLCEKVKIGGKELNLSNCGNLISYKDLMDKIR